MSSSSATLAGCLTSLQTSTALLNSSISILESGVSDLPRLSKVLSQTRHFELVPSSAISTAQEALLSELSPEVEELLSRVERAVEKLERREDSLRAKWELQEGRLGREVKGKDAAARQKLSAETSTARIGLGHRSASGGVEGLKAKQLRQKKERLSYAVETLQMQAQQVERKLRQSMATQEMQAKMLDAGNDEID